MQNEAWLKDLLSNTVMSVWLQFFKTFFFLKNKKNNENRENTFCS